MRQVNIFIGKLDWFGRELLNSFSNNPSFFSSKRIERFVLFVNAIIILDVWAWKNINKMNTADIIQVFGVQLLYAGFTMIQMSKDKKIAADKEVELKKAE